MNGIKARRGKARRDGSREAKYYQLCGYACQLRTLRATHSLPRLNRQTPQESSSQRGREKISSFPVFIFNPGTFEVRAGRWPTFPLLTTEVCGTLRFCKGWLCVMLVHGTALADEVDEGRKRVLAIAAGILVARHLKTADDLFGGPQGSPRTHALIAAAVQWAERIMGKIDKVCS